jgi:hypothetical protein
MGVVIIDHKLTKEDIKIAREEYLDYIKITIDIEQEAVAIGGQYHADAEKVLVEKFGSKNTKTWGGGYDIPTKTFEANALLNIKSRLENNSNEILDPVVRKKFMDIAKKKLSNIESLV